MQASFTVIVEGDVAANLAFDAELAEATAAEVEREDAGLGIVETAAAVWTFVVTHREEIKTALELAPAVTKIVSGLIGLVQRRKVSMTLVEGGREIKIDATNRADLEAVMSDILRARPAGPTGS